MENVSVVVIDDNDVYRLLLSNYLTRNKIFVSGDYTHELFLCHTNLLVVPNIAIISFDDSPFQTEATISFCRNHYPLVKILINSEPEDRQSLNTINIVNVEGLIFKNEPNADQHLLKAIEALHKNVTFFL